MDRSNWRERKLLVVIEKKVEPQFCQCGTRRCYFPLLSAELASIWPRAATGEPRLHLLNLEV